MNLQRIKKGVRHPAKAARFVFLKRAYPRLSLATTSRLNVGTNVLTKDWDILVVLDSCRPEIFQEIATEYEYLSNPVDSFWSVGAYSAEWMANTFKNRYLDILQNTGYISANPHATTVLEHHLDVPEEEALSSAHPIQGRYLDTWMKTDIVRASDLGSLVYAWEYAPANDDIIPGASETDIADYSTPPNVVTDLAIREWRHKSLDRLILHYWQPHQPYLARSIRNQREPTEAELGGLSYLKETGDMETFLGLYKDELRFALDSIRTLIENVDADTVAFTADHGESLGEWGVYGHHAGSLLPYQRRVPWTTTTAEDTGTHTPTVERDPDPASAMEHLEALGYVQGEPGLNV